MLGVALGEEQVCMANKSYKHILRMTFHGKLNTIISGGFLL